MFRYLNLRHTGTLYAGGTDSADGMNTVVAVLAFLTGLLTGAVFAFFEVPIPAPPNIAGVLGIVGIYVGFKIVDASSFGFDLLGALGL